jgi:hypothetical protein
MFHSAGLLHPQSAHPIVREWLISKIKEADPQGLKTEEEGKGDWGDRSS